MKGDINDIIDHLIERVEVWEDQSKLLIQTVSGRALQGHLDRWSLQVFAYPDLADPAGRHRYEGRVIGPGGVHQMTQAAAKKAWAVASSRQKKG
jgi:hypothetical protein